LGLRVEQTSPSLSYSLWVLEVWVDESVTVESVSSPDES